MSTDNLTLDLIEDENEVLCAYTDSEGYITIGVGILIDKRRGGCITQEESRYLLANRIKSKTDELLTKAPWVKNLSPARLDALLNMAFQMGVEGLLGFKNSLALLQQEKFNECGANMRMSKWHSQTPARSERVIKQLVTGEYRR
jgi:lysozyme